MLCFFRLLLFSLRRAWGSPVTVSEVCRLPQLPLASCLQAYLLDTTSIVSAPCSDEFVDGTEINNLYARQYASPGVVIEPLTFEDVQMAVRGAQFCNSPKFTVLSGGHNAAGYNLNNGGVVLNMKRMNSYDVNYHDLVLTASSGVHWNTVYQNIAGTGVLVTGGGCPTVGIAGFTLGGGWSWISRSAGLAADNLLEATVVLADASIVTVSEDEVEKNPLLADLWFGLRGAGGGNFGVVVQMKMRLHRDTEVGTTGEVCWRRGSRKLLDVLVFYKQLILEAPLTFNAPAIIANMGGPVQQVCLTIVNRRASGAEELSKLMMFEPDTVELHRQDLSTFENRMDLAATSKAGYFYTNSVLISAEMYTKEFVRVVLRNAAARIGVDDTVVFHVGGGKIAEVPSNATAFPWREALFCIQIKGIWSDPIDAPDHITWVNNFYLDLKPYSMGSYVNYMNPVMPDWPTRYYGENLPRLLRAKEAYDPKNFFSFPLGLGNVPDNYLEIAEANEAVKVESKGKGKGKGKKKLIN